MKRLLIGGLAVGSMLFAASGVATAVTSPTPLAAPVSINLDATTLTSHVVAGPDGNASWPLASQPGILTVSFAAPAGTISGYVVTCKPPTVDTTGAPISLHNLVATFAVDPATGNSTDPDFDNTSSPGIINLQVGPETVVDANTVAPQTCSIVATNAAGASKPGKPNKPVSPALESTCGADASTAPNPPTHPNGTGLLAQLGAGDISQLVTGLKAPVGPFAFGTTTPVSGVGKQTSTNYTAVVATITGVGTFPFCTTSPTYHPALLNNQQSTFTPTTAQIAAVLTGPKAHPAQVKISGLNVNSPVKSGITLVVDPGATVIYAYDGYDYTVPAGGCPSSATLTCSTNSAAIVAGSGGQLPATDPATGAPIGYIAVINNLGQTIAPGKPIVSAPASITFQRTGNPNPTPPGLDLHFGGAQLGLTISGTAVGLQVAPPAAVIAATNTSYVSVGIPACASSAGPATATCLPYTTVGTFSGYPPHANYTTIGSPACASVYTGPAVAGKCVYNPYTGGDTNYGSSIARAPLSLF